MSLTWCQLGASLCLIGVSAWGITEAVRGKEPARPIEVAGPAVEPEEVAEVVRWAREHRGIDGAAPVTAALVRPQPIVSRPGSEGIPVPANAPKGGGRVTYVGEHSGLGSVPTGGRAHRAFRQAQRKSEYNRASRWVPRFSSRSHSPHSTTRRR